MHPYKLQPPKAFWKKVISPYHPMDITDWYTKRFEFEDKKIATAGSCFAQHIRRNLRKYGFNYLDYEKPPLGIDENLLIDLGYNMYSTRYGNIYTSRQLIQLLNRSKGTFVPSEGYWEKRDGVVDPFQPTIEPEPFSSVDEVEEIRKHHLEAVEALIEYADIFVFTLGLTETWRSKADGAVYPLCPGTSGGEFDPSKYEFHNLSFSETLSNMREFIAQSRRINKSLEYFITVSPVPLMATATENQVAVATTHSKSILRAVAGELYSEFDFVDYFPSYEIITSPFMRGYFFQPDCREVSTRGVQHMMSVFFSQHDSPSGCPTDPEERSTNGKPKYIADNNSANNTLEDIERIRCDKEILSAFGDS